MITFAITTLDMPRPSVSVWFGYEKGEEIFKHFDELLHHHPDFIKAPDFDDPPTEDTDPQLPSGTRHLRGPRR